MQIITSLRNLYYRINWSYVFVGALITIWTLYELTDFEYVVYNVFSKFFGYVIMPILAVGAGIVFWENIQKIFKKDALSEGILMYILWWVWVIMIFLFGIGAAITTWHFYFN